MRKWKGIIIHCSDSSFGSASIINKWHKERGWRGIGYHFVILNGVISPNTVSVFMNGAIEKGRPLTMTGAHAKGYNRDYIGICLIGDGSKPFTKAQMNALIKLLKELVAQFSIKPENILGHNEVNPNKTCPCFNVKEFLNKHKEEIYGF